MPELTLTEEIQLVASALAQTSRADDRLVRYLTPVIDAVAKRFRLSAARQSLGVDDLVNGILAKIWNRNLHVLRTWDQQKRLQPYIRKVAQNYCIERVRILAPDLVGIDGPEDLELPFEGASPEDEINIQEIQELMHIAMQQLSGRDALVIRLRHLEGLGHAEIAHRLGWPLGTVGTTLVRAEEKLKRVVGSKFPGLLSELGISDSG